MLTFRRATLNDAATLWLGHNDPITRAMSKYVETVSSEDYRAWLSDRLGDPGTKFMIAERCNLPVGSFRISGNLLSYQVASDFRRHGIATAMLRAIKRDYGSILAEIFVDNEASIRAARRAGLDVQIIPRVSNTNETLVASG